MDMNGKTKYYIANEAANQVQFSNSTDRCNKNPCWKRRRTTLEIALFIICVICLIVTTVLIVREATRYKGSQGENAPQTSLCMTQDCIKAAARLLNGMDQSVDPCDDFFEYACGAWNKINIIPDDRSSYNTFAKLRDDLLVTLKDLLERPVFEDELSCTKKAKWLYQSCVNETLINERDLDPVFDLLDELGGWPVTSQNNTWDDGQFDLIDLMVKLRLYNNKILVDQWVSADDKNSNVNIIQLDQPELGMPSREYYTKGTSDPDVEIYEKFMVDVAMLFGANRSTAMADMKKVVDLEINLANVTIPQEKRRDNELMYNKMTVKTLSERIPGFNWMRYLNGIFNTVNMTIKEEEEIVVYAPQYLSDLSRIIQQTSNRTLANYLIWRIMMNRVTNLPKKYRDLRTEYYKRIFGSDTERSRWRDCITYVSDNMGNAVGRLFVEEHFDESAKNIALDMIHDIRQAFYDLLEEVPWMDEKTRIVAEEKAEAMEEKIGYPPSILNDTSLDESYRHVNFHPDKYFENVLENIRSIALANSEKLRDRVDKSQWSTTPVVVNAFYSAAKNQILFPAGILQPPFYNKGYPKSMNYGGIGMVIGHEITHGFDDRGRQFDKNGNLQQWWDDDVIDRFKDMAECFVSQYGNYTIDGVNVNLNGVQTLGENIADNGGLLEAYRAYEKWEDMQERDPPRLPGLEQFSNKHLFFLNFAQIWCGSMRPEAAINRLRTGLHSPGRFRVIGTLQNSKDFSRVYQCPKGSRMNPIHKCRVW